MELMTKVDIAEYLGVSPRGSRVTKWLKENGIVHVEDFGEGRNGGKRWRDTDVYAVHERKAQQEMEHVRAQVASKGSLCDMSWKDAKQAIAKKQVTKKGG